MRFRQFYRIGARVVLLDTPEPLIEREPYTLFACGEAPPDHTVRFDRAPGPFVPGDDVLFENEVVRVTADGNGWAAWYHGLDDDRKPEVYAVRRREGERAWRVQYLDRYADMLWPRVAFNLMGLEEFSAQNDLFVMHASFVEYGGGAVVFTAPSGGGKSTQASLWETYAGAQLCNEDKAILSEDGAFVCGVPFRGSGTACRNVRLPLRCVVRIEKSKETRLARVTGAEAFRVLFESCYKVLWDRELLERNVSLCERIAGNTPVFRLYGRPDEDAVRTLRQYIDR